jgi:CubicO group peptidase (beta-lactamase class C family)
MIRYVGRLAIAGLLAGALPSAVHAQPAAIASASADTATLDKIIGDAIAAKKMVGASIAIARGSEPPLILSYGKADVENDVAVTPASVFRVGSVTKQFTAAAIMLLVERGQVSLDDPIYKFIPDFPMGDKVTIRHLLTHTSGIHNYTTASDIREKMKLDRTPREMVAFIKTLDPVYDFAPGERWNYSNSGFLLLGYIVEEVSGVPYGTFIRDNLLKPIGMNDTATDTIAAIVPHRAHGYSMSEKGEIINTDYLSMTAPYGAGEIRSTAADLVRWHKALLGGKVLKPESLALMTAPAHLNNGKLTSTSYPVGPRGPSEYGFGLVIGTLNGKRTIGHTGSINGFRSQIMTLPDEKLTVVMLVNADVPGDVRERIFDAAVALGQGKK